MAEAATAYAPMMRSESRRNAAIADEHCRRYEALKLIREPYMVDWQDIQRLLVPGHDCILDDYEPGWSRTQYIYDSQPLMSPLSLAGNLMSGVTNQFYQWSNLKFRDEELNETQEVARWLREVDQRMHSAYAASSFYQAAHTFYVNLGGFGTACMWVGSRLGYDGSYLHFKTLPTGSYVLAESADGYVDTVYRDVWWTPRQAVQKFGNECSPQMIAWAKEANQQDQFKRFLHCSYPRSDRNGEKWDNQNMPYADVYIEYDTKHVCDESGQQEFPYVVSRWETLSRAPYGFGPGHIALPDVRMLNVLRELNMTQLSLWVRPPLQVLQEGFIGAISLENNAVNVVRQMDALKPLDLTGRPDLVQIDQADLRRSIQDIFFVNALQAIPPPEASNMTAYEVAQRVEQMQRVMGPAMGRILSEMLDPLADRVFGVMLRGGALPQPPREVFLAATRTGGQIDVEYQGPLARSQRMGDVQAFERALALAGQVIQLTGSTAILDNIDMDAGFREAAKLYGIPQDKIVDMKQMVRMRDARNQQQQAMQQMAQTRENMMAMGRVAPLVSAMQQGGAANQPQGMAA